MPAQTDDEPWRIDQEQPPLPSERTPLLSEPSRGLSRNQAQTPTEDADSADEEQTIVTGEVSNSRLAIILCTSWVGVFLGAIDATVIATLSAPISSEFKSLSLISWLTTAYLISNAAFQPISGRLTDIFGRGPGLVFSNVVFAAGNLICGLSRDEYSMILGRVIAGIGGGGLMSISTFLGSDLVPLRKRGLIQGIGNICYGSGAMLGGVFGGLVNDHTAMGWRLAFLLQVPPVLVSAVLAAYLVHVPPKQSDRSYLARIDFGGVFLTIAFLVLLLLGLNAGGNLVPWTHPLVLTTLPLSLVALLTFVWWEGKTRQPVIPVRLLLDRTISTACIANLMCTMAMMMALFYVPIYLQVLGASATEAGARILPSPVGTSIGSLACGYIMKRTGKYLRLGMLVVLIFVIGTAALACLNESSPGWLISIAFFLLGSGYGSMLTITLLACIAAVDHSHQAVITSATYAFRSVGATVGLTIASAIYQNILKARLWQRFGDYPDAAKEIARIRDDLGELGRLPDGWRDGVIQSFMEAFRGVWLSALGMGIVALVCVSLMRQHTLHSNLERK